MLFDIVIDGVEEIERRWTSHALPSLVEACQEGAQVAAEEGAAVARQRVPVSPGPGPHLRDRILVLAVRSELGESGAFRSVAFDIKADRPYASFVDGGTRAHEIRARRASALAWENSGQQGDWHFAKVVHHPGTAPHPFMGPAHQQAERTLEREVNARVERVCDRLNED